MADETKKPSQHFIKTREILETPPPKLVLKSKMQHIAWNWLLEVERDGDAQTQKLAKALRIILSEKSHGPR